MATQEPEGSQPSDHGQATEVSRETHEGGGIMSDDSVRDQADSEALGIKTEAATSLTDLHNQDEDEAATSPGQDTPSQATSSILQFSQAQGVHDAVLSPKSKLFTPQLEKDTSPPAPAFSSPRLDHRTIDLGVKRREPQQAVQYDDAAPAKTSTDLERNAHGADVPTPLCISFPTAAASNGQAHYHSTSTTPSRSDALSDGQSMSASSQFNEIVRYQVDEQIYQEASMSHGMERSSSPALQSADVIYMGTGHLLDTENPPSGAAVDQENSEVPRPIPQSSRAGHNASLAVQDSLRDDRRAPSGLSARMSMRNSHVKEAGSRPVPRSYIHLQQPNTAPAPTPAPAPMSAAVQEVIDVVAYKFKQNEQKLRREFDVGINNLRRELQQASEENDDLRSQVEASEVRCDRSEAAIVKYRNQIGKARALQKFLDGLGSDLHNLKQSYDVEKSNFAKRIEISETEIMRLESTLTTKNEFERMLSHSKASLERLLEARGFELQSVVQHRDMLQNQLEDRIGQLVEERDTRLRLEQQVAELRNSERSSLAASIEQTATSLMSKFRDLDRQDDQLVVSVAGLQDAIKSLAEQPSVSPHDFEAIKAELHDLWLRIAQSLCVEATTDTTVAEISSSVEGIIQNHMQMLRQGLIRLESSSKHSANTALAQATFQAELQTAAERFGRTEAQLETVKQSEAALQNALIQSKARISELEATPVPASTVDTTYISPQDVETKVKEAVIEARKEYANNAHTFIAQEKARFSNDLQKAVSECRKAVGESQAQKEKINKLQFELEDLQSSTKDKSDQSLANQVDEINGRFRALEEKYNAAQIEVGERKLLESNLAAVLAEQKTAQAKLLIYETRHTVLTQEAESCNKSLSQARAAERQAKMQVEELRIRSRSDIDDLCRKLSQAEERSRYAETGLAQMKTSAEKAISEEQEKHRKQREALQKRLDEAQSELQMKSEEADSNRAFVERTVAQQQAVWQRSQTELETKAADYKTKLEEKIRLLESAQDEQDALRANIASLQKEIKEHHHAEAEHRSCEDNSQAVIDDLRIQLDTVRTEVSSLQAVQQRYLREKDERSSREAKAKLAVDELRKDRDAANSLIANLQAYQKRSEHKEVERDKHDKDKEKEMDKLRNDRDEAQTMLWELQARLEAQALRAQETENSHWVAPQPEQEEQFPAMAPPGPRYPASLKQRKKADRNTYTVVSSAIRHGSGVARSTRSNVMSGRAQVPLPRAAVSTSFMTDQSHDEMLDILSSQPEAGPESQIVSSMQEYRDPNRADLQSQKMPPQAHTASLDFSSKPLVANREKLTTRTPGLGPSKSVPVPDFKLYEDSQDSINDGLDEESALRANFTFRKPHPLPNSGSKRLSRTASDKSLEGRVTSSRRKQQSPEVSGDLMASRATKTPEVSKYSFGSSPEFMNPPSTKTKRRYSGNTTGMPSNLDPAASHRSATPALDPRIATRPGGNKRVAVGDIEENNDLEQPVKKRQATQGTVQSAGGGKRSSDDSFSSRSSQSISDLSRVEDVNPRCGPSKMPASHMRSSASTRRVTRNQKATQDDAYKVRFRQELR